MTIVSPLLVALAVAFLVVAAVAGIVAIAAATQFVVSNRRIRLAEHDTIRHYYGGFALHH